MIPTNIQHEEREVFTDTLAKIVKAIEPEKIICFGNRTDYYESWSSFRPKGSARYLAYYDILIITKEGDDRKDYEILNLIDAINEAPIHFTAVVRSIGAVNKAIREGSLFFVAMHNKAMTVYDNYNVPLAIPDGELDEQKLAGWADDDWNRLFTLAKKYHILAGMCVSRATDPLHDMSAFMLHQSVEVACRTIIRYYTGYRAETHDLRRLLWLMRNFTLEGENVFPQNTDEEIELIDTLDNAYSDVRYGHDYEVPVGVILTLLPRVRSFMEVAEKLYREKRHSLEGATFFG
jgi:HEPN domain-containing protein